MKEIQQTEVTFEIMEVRTVKDKKKEWIEIKVKVTDDHGSRIQTVREGDVLKALFEGEVKNAQKSIVTSKDDQR